MKNTADIFHVKVTFTTLTEEVVNPDICGLFPENYPYIGNEYCNLNCVYEIYFLEMPDIYCSVIEYIILNSLLLGKCNLEIQ